MYKRILFSVEFINPEKDYPHQVEKFIKQWKAELFLIQVIPYDEVFTKSEVKNKILSLATDFLNDIGNELLVPAVHRNVRVGDSRKIIPSYIVQENIDLLILAYNKKNILTSLTYDLMMRTTCDILILN